MTVAADEQKLTVSADEQKTMKRVVVDHYGGPEVLRVVEDDVPRPGPGEVRVRVLAAGVSFTDAQLRAGTYLGVPKPPFTPGYELVGVVEELGPGCSRLQEGDRIGALTVWGAPTRSASAFWRRTRSRCPRTSTRRRS
jgi:NADPH:quinone reductase-like Zn-dependent oxidoreductase